MCGSTVYWEGTGFPGLVAVAIGTFADPDFPAADHLGVGGMSPPLGALVVRPSHEARNEAGMRIANRSMLDPNSLIGEVICRH